jgi:hypothetical protein
MKYKRSVVVPMRVVIDANMTLYDDRGQEYQLRSLQVFHVEPQAVFRRVPRSGFRKKAARPCAYCGREAKLTRDHIIPKSMGYDFKYNMAEVCYSCNSRKGSQTLGQWLQAETLSSDFLNIFRHVALYMQTHTMCFIPEVYKDWFDYLYSV